MATDDEELLDVFIGIKPKPDFLADVDKLIDSATKRIMDKFGSLVIPSPKFAAAAVTGGGSGGAAGGGVSAALKVASNEAAILNRRYVEALDSAKELQRTTEALFDNPDLSKDVKLAESFRQAKNELKEIVALLQIGKRDADEIAINPIEARLSSLRAATSLPRDVRYPQGPSVIGADTSRAAEIAQLVKEVEQIERLNRQKDNIRSSLAQGALQGIGFDDKQALRSADAVVKSAEADFSSLIRTFRGTQDELDAIILKFLELNGVAEINSDVLDRLKSNYRNGIGPLPIGDDAIFLRPGRQETQSAVQNRRGRSRNNLANNSYQLGQAVEDFAVGFSLNGISGGIRGAANNVAFILNDLSQMDAVQARIGKKWADALPLIAGIGSAIAITVLPPMIDWLESLNDIEDQFDDISKQIVNEFEDINFDVKLRTDERGFRKSINEANELREVLMALKGAADEIGENKIETVSVFKGLSGATDFSKGVAAAEKGRFSAILTLTKTQRDLENSKRRTPGSDDAFLDIGAGLGEIFIGPADYEKNIKLLKDFDKLSNSVAEKTRKIVEDGARGVVNPEEIRKLRDEYEKLQAVSPKALPLIDFGDEKDMKEYVTNISALEGVLKVLSRSADQAESSNRKLAEGLEDARKKSAFFAREQNLVAEIISGSASEASLEMFKLLETFNNVASGLESGRRKALGRVAGDNEAESLVNEQVNTLRESLRIKTVNDLLLKQKDIREQIDDLKSGSGRSELTTPEKVIQDIIKNQFSIDDKSDKALKDLTEQLNILNETIRAINANMLGPLSTEEQAIRSIPFGGPLNAMNLGATLDFAAYSFIMRDAVVSGMKEALADLNKPVVEELKDVNKGIRNLPQGAQ